MRSGYEIRVRVRVRVRVKRVTADFLPRTLAAPVAIGLYPCPCPFYVLVGPLSLTLTLTLTLIVILTLTLTLTLPHLSACRPAPPLPALDLVDAC